MDVLNVTQVDFEAEVLGSDVPVLVDFWAPWCGPCKMIAPAVEEISAEADGFKVVKVNVDDESLLIRRYGVQTIPTLVVFENGEEKARSSGVIPKDKILELLR